MSDLYISLSHTHLDASYYGWVSLLGFRLKYIFGPEFASYFDSLPTAVVGAVPTSVLFLPALRSFSIHLLPLWHAWFLAVGWLVFSVLLVCCWVDGCHAFSGIKFADCVLF